MDQRSKPGPGSTVPDQSQASGAGQRSKPCARAGSRAAWPGTGPTGSEPAAPCRSSAPDQAREYRSQESHTRAGWIERAGSEPGIGRGPADPSRIPARAAWPGTGPTGSEPTAPCRSSAPDQSQASGAGQRTQAGHQTQGRAVPDRPRASGPKPGTRPKEEQCRIRARHRARASGPKPGTRPKEEQCQIDRGPVDPSRAPNPRKSSAGSEPGIGRWAADPSRVPDQAREPRGPVPGLPDRSQQHRADRARRIRLASTGARSRIPGSSRIDRGPDQPDRSRQRSADRARRIRARHRALGSRPKPGTGSGSRVPEPGVGDQGRAGSGAGRTSRIGVGSA